MALLSVLSGNPVSNPNVAFTWRHYIRLFDSDLYFDALVATLRIGGIMMLISLLIGSIPGIILGSYLAPRMPDRIIRPILAMTLALVAWKLIFHSK